MHAQTEPIWIADGAGFDALIADVEASDRVAIDTEFHGERTYVPKLMLVQIATERAIYLVDPLSDIDLPALCDALAQPDGPLVIGHALHNDLEIIFLRCGKLLPRVFDTQIAAAFLGHGLQVGLANLVSRLCDTRLAKDGQMADWSRRPLSDKLRRYAADDVRYLLAVHDTLARGLRERQREAWVMEECARLADGARYQRSPERAYLRVGRHRTLRNPDLGVLAAVAAERERLASELDIVPHFLVPDDLLLAMARGAPQTRAEMKSHRRLNHRQISRYMDRWLAAIRVGLENPVKRAPALPPAAPGVDSTAALAMLLVSAIADEHELASQLLVKRAQLKEALQRGVSSQAQLLEIMKLAGWRAELVGVPLWDLFCGRIAAVCVGEPGVGAVRFVHTEGKAWCPPPAPPATRQGGRRSRGGRSRRRRGGRRRRSSRSEAPTKADAPAPPEQPTA